MATRPYPCCTDDNLIVSEADQDPKRPDVTVRRCATCNRRHIVWRPDPISFHVTGAALASPAPQG